MLKSFIQLIILFLFTSSCEDPKLFKWSTGTLLIGGQSTIKQSLI